MEWIDDVGPYSYLARYYGLHLPGTSFDHVSIGERQLCIVRREDGFHILADSHDRKTCEWLLHFAGAHPGEKVRAFISAEDLDHLPKSPSWADPEIKYYVYLWNSSLGMQNPPIVPVHFIFRFLHRSDLAALQSLWNAKWLHPFVPAHFDYEEFINNPNLGAFDGEKLVGVAGLFGQSVQDIELGRLFTALDYRGIGIQKALVPRLVDEIRSKGDRRRIYSWTMMDNVSAQKVLDSAGFRKIGSLCIVEFKVKDRRSV